MPNTPPTIEIHCIGSCDPATRQGHYELCVISGASKTYRRGSLDDTTPNRCIIQGMIDMVSKLPTASAIKLVSNTNVGIKRNTGVNADLTKALHAAIAAGGHSYIVETVTGTGSQYREFIRSGSGYECTHEKQYVGSHVAGTQGTFDLLSESPKPIDPARHWIPYTLNPIDYGWEHLSTVDETLKVFLKAEDEAKLQAQEGGYRLQPDDLPYPSEQFRELWSSAKAMALAICGDDEFRDEPCVLWIPGDMQFQYAFVFKMDNNGTTFVISPVEMPWLKPLCITNEILQNKSQGMTGSFKQIRWAESIVQQACDGLEQMGRLIPELSEPLKLLAEIIRSKRDASWIIANKNKLALGLDSGGSFSISQSSVRNHAILGDRGAALLGADTRRLLEPLIVLGEARLFMD